MSLTAIWSAVVPSRAAILPERSATSTLPAPALAVSPVSTATIWPPVELPISSTPFGPKARAPADCSLASAPGAAVAERPIAAMAPAIAVAARILSFIVSLPGLSPKALGARLGDEGRPAMSGKESCGDRRSAERELRFGRLEAVVEAHTDARGSRPVRRHFVAQPALPQQQIARLWCDVDKAAMLLIGILARGRGRHHHR